MSRPGRASCRNSIPLRRVILIQAVVLLALTGSWSLMPRDQKLAVAATALRQPYPLTVNLRSSTATVITSLHADERVISDADLQQALRMLIPRFSRSQLRPNLIEHALRTWGSTIDFGDPDAISGPEMAAFLTDSARHLESWNNKVDPMIDDAPQGVYVPFGGARSNSVHHDHALAALTESGLALDYPVITPRRTTSVRYILDEALRDFRLDGVEPEWSVLSFGLWMAQDGITEWHNGSGRRISFDSLVNRLVREAMQRGVCLGTHRVYTLAALLRLHHMHDQTLLRPATAEVAARYLHEVQRRIEQSQNEDGSWSVNWMQLPEGPEIPTDDSPLNRSIIATGHHLEWMAISPEEFHVPREQIIKAGEWLTQQLLASSPEDVELNYTYYSHVVRALALWRGSSPAEFYAQHAQQAPDPLEPEESSLNDAEEAPEPNPQPIDASVL